MYSPILKQASPAVSEAFHILFSQHLKLVCVQILTWLGPGVFMGTKAQAMRQHVISEVLVKVWLRLSKMNGSKYNDTAAHIFVCVCWSLLMHLHAAGKRVINHCLGVRAYVCVFRAFSARSETLLILTVGIDGSHYLWCRPPVTVCCHHVSCQLPQDDNRTNTIWPEPSVCVCASMWVTET